jgi:hypothetical protein
MHTAEPLALEPISFKVETASEELKICKLPGTDKIPVELIQAGIIHYVLGFTDLLILFGIRKNTATAVKGIYNCTYL